MILVTCHRRTVDLFPFRAAYPQPLLQLDTQLVSSTEDSRVGVFGVSSVWVCLGQAVMVSEHVKGLLLTQVVSVVSIPAIPTPRS